MGLATVGWRTQTGQWITDPLFRPEICVSAWTDLDPAGENGIDRVEFVVDDGTGPETVTVSSRTLRFPNYSKAKTPLQQRRTGVLTPFRGFGFKLILTDYGPVITITATAFSRSGTATPLDRTIRIYNDTDGFDRRPSKKEIHVDPAGNNAAVGDETHPVADYQTALGLVRANPAGTTSADRDAGGAKIVFHAGTYVMGNTGGVPPTHTSGDRWITVECRPGAKFRRETLASSGFLAAPGNGAGTAFRLWFVNPEIEGLGGVMANSSSVVTEVMLDGLYYHSEHWSKQRRWSVRFWEDQGKPMKMANTGPNAQVYVTCALIRGVLQGLSEVQVTHDFLITDYCGIALETYDFGSGGGQICNGIVERQRAYVDVMGRFRGLVGDKAIVTIPGTGLMRIDAVGPTTFTSEGDNDPVSLATLAEIAGRSFWRVALSGGFPPGGTGLFQVVSAGTNGNGFGYVVVANPNATAGLCNGTARLETALSNGITDLSHPDVIFFGESGGGVGQTNAMVEGLTMRDLYSTQGLFNPVANQRRLAIVNVRDGCRKIINHPMQGGSKTDVRIIGCTLNSAFQFGGAQTSCSGYDNVLNQASGIDTSGTNKWSHNHFISGSTFGANATTGAWFQSNPLLDPYLYLPLPARLDTGSGLEPTPVEARFLGSVGTTRGCDRFVALFDWSVPDDTVPIVDIQVLVPMPLVAGVSMIAGCNVDVVAPLPLAASISIAAFPVIQVVAPMPLAAGVTLLAGSTVDVVAPIPLSADVQIVSMDPSNPVLVSVLAPIPLAASATVLAGSQMSALAPIPLNAQVQIEADATVHVVAPIPLVASCSIESTARQALEQPFFPAPGTVREAPGELRRWPLRRDGDREFWS